ncbi:hypothetical protein G9A89_000450 [Geosiphon pyriformis]|nr:hypothetical protein G9A89_000450 [Geosiphon pyriformis]
MPHVWQPVQYGSPFRVQVVYSDPTSVKCHSYRGQVQSPTRSEQQVYIGLSSYCFNNKVRNGIEAPFLGVPIRVSSSGGPVRAKDQCPIALVLIVFALQVLGLKTGYKLRYAVSVSVPGYWNLTLHLSTQSREWYGMDTSMLDLDLSVGIVPSSTIHRVLYRTGVSRIGIYDA